MINVCSPIRTPVKWSTRRTLRRPRSPYRASSTWSTRAKWSAKCSSHRSASRYFEWRTSRRHKLSKGLGVWNFRRLSVIIQSQRESHSNRILFPKIISRCGRAARESSGVCYRLYTKEEQDKFADFAKPEIVRSSLESILLQLSALNVKNFNKFDFLDKPSAENIKKSAAILERLSAIKKLNDNEYEVGCLVLGIRFELWRIPFEDFSLKSLWNVPGTKTMPKCLIQFTC